MPVILETIKENSRFWQALFDNLLSRKELANILGVNRTSIWRWERNIIDKIHPIKQRYYLNSRSPYLDAYQRFLLIIIFIIKQEIDESLLKNSEPKRFLKLNFQELTRENFELWRKENVSIHS
ncbi:hypothetical protein [Nostoc sp. FACHB-110]|uniref:hypothetical protein n=1 Tax=Nostoc sp. FACHB-110 TaxID=2692834 RepID=UPI0016885A46|nr:hypothetical protein [Nostoc sp. FACHB-110]MBD2441380.1 hypothetical protein [Nostoc sp. FACHB-110]